MRVARAVIPLLAMTACRAREDVPAKAPDVQVAPVDAARPAPPADAIAMRPPPVSQSPSARPSVPPSDRMPAMPVRWHCAKNVDIADMSTCYATSEQCDTGRGSLTAAGAHYTTCLPQDAASCFTFHSKLLDRISFDCSATIAACERQRNYALTEARADVGDVHDCTTWRAGPDDDDPPTRPSKRYGGNVLYCSDMAANGQVIHRYTCQFEEADCMRMADGIERSGEAAFRAQGKDVDVTMGRCKKSTEPAYCALFDDGYTCTALKVHCDAMAAEALRSGKVATVGRCVEWRPGKHL